MAVNRLRSVTRQSARRGKREKRVQARIHFGEAWPQLNRAWPLLPCCSKEEKEMGMVFCRGCGKEIHETAPMCPHCGAPQIIPSTKRSVGKLIAWGLLWTLVFSTIISTFVTGLFVNILQVAVSQPTIDFISRISTMISLWLSIVLVILGKLPGTRKPQVPTVKEP